MRELTLLLLVALAGCGPKVDKFVATRVVDRGAPVPDVDMVCELGVSLAHPLAALGSERRPPHKALIIAEAASGMCLQPEVWEAELLGIRSRRNLVALGEGRTAEVKDARLREKRAHAAAADRFYRAYLRMEQAFGVVGEGCPALKERDELVYLLGLYAGTFGLLHDRRSGGEVGVPLDTIAHIARGSVCLDDAEWWSVPGALQAAWWTLIPGSEPDGVDPWQSLEERAAAGDRSGVRLARALQVVLADNAGRQDLVAAGIRAHAQALKDTPADPEWALFDEYARLVTLHESDLIWTEDRGHRAAALGDLPGPDPVEEPASPLPFEGDPFGEDPFAEPAPPSPPTDESGD